MAVLKALFETGAGDGGVLAGAVGATSRSAGRSGINSRITGIRTAAAPAMQIATTRHPAISVAQTIEGMKIQRAVAVLAVSTPMARPRWLTNQRDWRWSPPAPSPTRPDQVPDSTPQVAIGCQGSVYDRRQGRGTAPSSRGPDQGAAYAGVCISAAAKGPDQAVEEDTEGGGGQQDGSAAQPNSVCQGGSKHARRRAQAGGGQQREEGDAGDGPARSSTESAAQAAFIRGPQIAPERAKALRSRQLRDSGCAASCRGPPNYDREAPRQR